MMIYKLLLTGVTIILLSGCSTTQPKPEPLPPIVTTIYEIREVYITKACDIEMPECDFTGDGFEPTLRLLECLIDHKRALEYCTK